MHGNGLYHLLLVWMWMGTCVRILQTQDTPSSNDTERNSTCSWSVDGGRNRLTVSWSGDVPEDSNVTVEATKLSNDDNCKYASLEVHETFGKRSVDLKVCPNVQHRVTLRFDDCFSPETNRMIWTPPEPPPNVTFRNVGDTRFTVSWTRPSGSGDIELYNVDVTAVDFHLPVNSSTKEAEISSLWPYTFYSVRVAAKNKDFWGEYSDAKEVRTQTGIPHAPVNVTETSVSNTSVALRWDEPPISTGPILGYRVQWRNSSGAEEEEDSEGTSHEVKGLSPYAHYEFRVSAETEAGRGALSDAKIIQTEVGVPLAPKNLEATYVSNTSIGLKWEEAPASTGPILNYRIRWRNSNNESRTENTPSNETHHTLKRLVPFVLYVFGVSAVTEAGAGESSDELKIRTTVGVPHAPRNVTVGMITNTSVEVNWKEPSVSTGPVVGYRILWKNSSLEGEEDTTSEAPSHTLKYLTPYVNYTLRVSALTSAGPGERSSEVTFRTEVGTPHAPRNVTFGMVTNASVEVNWKEPSVSTGPVVGYRILWKNSSLEGEEDTRSAVPSYTLKHLTPYVNYTLRVLALTSAGPGEGSSEVTFRTEVGTPHAPRNVTVGMVTNTSVEVNWKEPSVSTGPVVGYRILWKNSSLEGEEDTRSALPSYTLKHLTPYVNYTLRVSALTSAGPGEGSSEVTFRTKVGTPHAPRNVTVGMVTNTSVEVNWKEPSVSTGPVVGYRILWKNSSLEGEEDTRSAVPSYTLKHLTPYVNYTLRVSALTSAGPGEGSSEVTFRTEVGTPHAPRNVTVGMVTNTSVEVNWKEPSVSTGHVVGYRILWKNSSLEGEEDTRSAVPSYTLKHLTPYVNYTLRVSALTSAGPGEGSSEVTFRTEVGIPSEPRKLRLERVTDTSLSLEWDRPEFPNAPVLDYRLTYRLLLRDDVDAIHVTVRRSGEEASLRYEMGGLLPYTYYSVTVDAESDAGRGPTSRQLDQRTNIGVPLPARIVNVTHSWKRRTVVVHWTTEGAYPGPVDFSLETRKFPDVCSDRQKESVEKEAKGGKRAEEWRREQKTEVGELSPFGSYRFRILLKTSATEDDVYSPMSKTIRIDPEAPSEPLHVRADCTGSPTDLRIRWSPPDHPNGIITSYRIRYGIQSLSSVREVPVLDMCVGQSYVLKELRPESRYDISVSAKTENVSENSRPGRAEDVCTLPSGIPLVGDASRLRAEGSGPETVHLEWTEDTFSDFMGAIVRYAVLVGKPHSLGNATSGRRAVTGPPWFNFSSGVSNFYQATPPSWNPFRDDAYDPLECEILYEFRVGQNYSVLQCTIGLEKSCNETFCNGPLQPDTPYEMKIRAFTKGGFAETDLLYARSSPIPRPSVTGKVVVVVLVLFSVCALAAGAYAMKKKGHLDTWLAHIRAHLNGKEESKHDESTLEMEERTSPEPIQTKYFADHVRIMMSDSHLKFSMEFEKLKNESPRLPCTVAETEENRPKNRWLNIFPFDHSRVKLLPLCDEPGSDFINANYIPGFSGRREYIATQGPLPHVLDDFWRMVWEQSVNVIVMLTQCVERGKKKCEKYWPDSGETSYYGDLKVTSVSVSMLSSFVIRIFHMQSGSYERQVKQMHFTHWPDFGCPERPEDLIQFVNDVRDHLPRVAPGPILVHCSAGVGRTGTFIAVDRLMLQLRHAPDPGEDVVDVYGTVLELRHHRTNMVQTEDQYIYIHQCVQQLIEDRHQTSRENIYSNLAIETDTPRPTAPELPL